MMMASYRPRVSILIAVRNCITYLESTMGSIFNQSLSDWELVIIDDCSDDGTSDLVQAYASADARVRVQRMNQQIGQTKALAEGLKGCSAEFVARIDGDDEMMPQRLERQLDFFDSRFGTVLLGSDVEIIDELGRPYAVHHVPSGDATLRRSLLQTNPFFHPAVMFRREAAVRVGGYNHRYSLAQDYALWLRLAQEGEIANLPEVLTRYRIRSASASRALHRRQTAEFLRIQVSSIRSGLLKPEAALHMWKPLMYLMAPERLTRRRFAYRYSRDSRQGSFTIR
jgi:glycosyltransferase involved in cell wall biosynthesis